MKYFKILTVAAMFLMLAGTVMAKSDKQLAGQENRNQLTIYNGVAKIDNILVLVYLTGNTAGLNDCDADLSKTLLNNGNSIPSCRDALVDHAKQKEIGWNKGAEIEDILVITRPGDRNATDVKPVRVGKECKNHLNKYLKDLSRAQFGVLSKANGNLDFTCTIK